MIKLHKLQIQAKKAIEFLERHPALGLDCVPLFNSLIFDIEKVCKNGYNEWTKKDGITIHQRTKLAKKFKKEFQKEIAELKKECDSKSFKFEKPILTIDVPYEKVFGYPWKFDHVEYWGELVFVMYEGNPGDLGTKKLIENWDTKNWGRYSAIDDGASTFEEMIIKITKKFKRIYGKFNENSFITAKEKANNKKEPVFLKSKKSEKGYLLRSNPKYILVTDPQLNHRWVKWFSKTKTCKDSWVDSVKAILTGKNPH